MPDDRFAERTAGLAPAARHDPASAPLPAPTTRTLRRFAGTSARYYDLVSVMDAEAGEILAALEADGLADDTVVFFYGDHGWGLPRGKRWVYDSGLRVPLLVRWPGRIEPGTMRDDLVSFIDFAPTLLSLAGVSAPGHMQGRVFLGDDAAPEPEQLFFTRDRMDETWDPHPRGPRPPLQVHPELRPRAALRTAHRLHGPDADDAGLGGGWAAAGELMGPQRHFMAATKPAQELYDTETDPHEADDLAGEPAHAARLARMRAALDEWIVKTGDLGEMPEADLVNRFRPESVYQTAELPAADPPGGMFHYPPTVELTCPTEGATIEYTTEPGATPRWKLYTGPVRMLDWTLRFRCGRLGYFDSETVQYDFHIDYNWW